MKTKTLKKGYLFIILALFFFTVPLFQSLIFSSKSEGVITVDKSIDLHFIDSKRENILIYFGYVGCADICTPFLHKLSHLYESEKFKAIADKTEFYFVNLNPELEPSQVKDFASFFHEEFKGIYLSKQEIFQIDRNFALFFSPSLSESTEINHTDHLYHIIKVDDAYVLKKIYFTHPLSTDKLIDDIISQKKMM